MRLREIAAQWACLLVLGFSILALPMPAFPNEAEIGVIDFSSVLLRWTKTQEAMARVRQEFAAREREILDAQQELTQLRETAAAERAAPPEREQRALAMRIRRSSRDLRTLQTAFEQDYRIRQEEELLILQAAISAEIQRFALARNYALLLDSAKLVHVDDKLDLTDEFLKFIENKGAPTIQSQ